MSFEKINSAYMLFYEKKQIKDVCKSQHLNLTNYSLFETILNENKTF